MSSSHKENVTPTGPLPTSALQPHTTTSAPTTPLSRRNSTPTSNLESESPVQHGLANQLRRHPLSSSDDVFGPMSTDQVYLRLKGDFAKLALEEDRLRKIREGIFAKSRTLEAQRQELMAERLRLIEFRARVEQDRSVVAAQYAAAVAIQEDNEKKSAQLVTFANKLAACDQVVREREVAVLSSVVEEHARNQPPRSTSAAGSFSVHQDTIPGLHSAVPAVATNDGDRLPSTEATHTLRRRSTVVHRTSFRNLSFSGRTTATTELDVTDDSKTGDSPAKQSDAESASGAEFSNLRHTSSERRDRLRGRSVRRVLKSESLRDWEFSLD